MLYMQLKRPKLNSVILSSRSTSTSKIILGNQREIFLGEASICSKRSKGDYALPHFKSSVWVLIYSRCSLGAQGTPMISDACLNISPLMFSSSKKLESKDWLKWPVAANRVLHQESNCIAIPNIIGQGYMFLVDQIQAICKEKASLGLSQTLSKIIIHLEQWGRIQRTIILLHERKSALNTYPAHSVP